jgi:protein TonB
MEAGAALTAKGEGAQADAPGRPGTSPAAAESVPLDSAAIGAFESRVQAAVQAVAVYPVSARLQHRQGRARVRFTYTQGHALGALLMASSGSAVLDRAAIDAVQRASLPSPPNQIAARRLDLLVWVSFTLTSAAD